MKEETFCRCCLSDQCYKDMANDYYFGKNKENYFDMLLNVFNINISNEDALRCLICESCVSKLRDAANFKKQVLKTQETIVRLSRLRRGDIDINITPKTEDFDDFDDEISDNLNNDFLWDNTQQDTQKEVFVIKLETKEEVTENKPNNTISESNCKSKSNNSKTQQDGGAKDSTTFDITQTGATKDANSDEKCLLVEGTLKKKGVAAKRKPELQELSEPEIKSIQARENTLKLLLNSNVCLFRSLQNKFGCFFCKTSFIDVTELREHSATHTNYISALARRVLTLKGLSYKNVDISDLKCKLCSENCKDFTELINHLKNVHKKTFRGTEHFLIPYKLQNGFRCFLCDEQFNSYLRLSIHMNTHYTNNVCETCGQSFINRLSLRTHYQSMHKEKKCSLCPAIFLTACAKTKHQRKVHNLHNSKRHCNICKKTFRYTYLLDEHKIQEHGVKRDASNCTECGKTFQSSANLKVHVRSVHIKERNHPCSLCGMRFFTKCDQRRHEKTHEDVKSFSCSYCESKFKSKDSWRRHLKRQHGHVFGES